MSERPEQAPAPTMAHVVGMLEQMRVELARAADAAERSLAAFIKANKRSGKDAP